MASHHAPNMMRVCNNRLGTHVKLSIGALGVNGGNAPGDKKLAECKKYADVDYAPNFHF